MVVSLVHRVSQKRRPSNLSLYFLSLKFLLTNNEILKSKTRHKIMSSFFVPYKLPGRYSSSGRSFHAGFHLLDRIFGVISQNM